MPKKGQKGTNNAPFSATDEQRKIVANVCGAGLSVVEARKLIINPVTKKPISKPIFLREFRDEIELALLKRKVNVANTVYGLAVGQREVIRILQNGDREVMVEAVDPHPASAIFYCKAMLGWREHDPLVAPGMEQVSDDGLTDTQRTHRVASLLDRARTRQAGQAAGQAAGNGVDAPAGSTNGSLEDVGA